MKKNIAIISLLLAAIAQTAFANGVEKVLPPDATNVKLVETSLDQVATGQKLIVDGNDGPVYESTYSTMLYVRFTYDSSDDTDVPTRPTNDGIEKYGKPEYSVNFAVSDAEIAAIKAKKLDAKSLIAMSVSQQTVELDNSSFTASCRFNNDSAAPEDESCIKHETIKVSRPVLSVARK